MKLPLISMSMFVKVLLLECCINLCIHWFLVGKQLENCFDFPLTFIYLLQEQSSSKT